MGGKIINEQLTEDDAKGVLEEVILGLKTLLSGGGKLHGFGISATYTNAGGDRDVFIASYSPAESLSLIGGLEAIKRNILDDLYSKPAVKLHPDNSESIADDYQSIDDSDTVEQYRGNIGSDLIYQSLKPGKKLKH